MQALGGMLVVDLTRYVPGAFASSELLRLGARVVRVERRAASRCGRRPPNGTTSLNAGKESVVCDLPAEPISPGRCSPGRTSSSSRSVPASPPGSASVPDDAPADGIYCSITGFGVGGPHEQRAGHDLNYLGWAGLLDATGTRAAACAVADLAAGALGAVTEMLAALLAANAAATARASSSR